MRFARFLLVLSLFASGCVIGDNKYPKPRDLASSWLVDRARILAISAEPPEVAPGEPVSFSALIVDPAGELPFRVWVACPPSEDEAVGAACNLALEDLDLENATLEDLEAAGVIGIEPILPPTYVPDAEILANLTPEERLEGLSVTISLTALPADVAEVEEGDETDFDYNQVEASYKRLVVSEASTPNHNPQVDSWSVDGDPIIAGEPARVTVGQSIEVGVTLSEDSVEEYEYVNANGDLEIREETPYVLWYTDQGTISEDTTLYPYLDSTWIAPTEPGITGTWWAVVRDRRGGMSWSSQTFITQ